MFGVFTWNFCNRCHFTKRVVYGVKDLFFGSMSGVCMKWKRNQLFKYKNIVKRGWIFTNRCSNYYSALLDSEEMRSIQVYSQISRLLSSFWAYDNVSFIHKFAAIHSCWETKEKIGSNSFGSFKSFVTATVLFVIYSWRSFQQCIIKVQ